MELRQLAAFDAVLEHGTFAAAARARRIAQPALWAQVKALESELGVPLFERDGRRVRPTRAALLLRERARLALADATSVATLAREIREGHAAPARIGCAPYHVPHTLAPILARMHRRDPMAPLAQIVSVTSATAESALRSGEIDLVVAPRIGGLPGFRIARVFLAVLGKDVRSRTLDVRQLHRRPIATMPRGTGMRDLLEAIWKKETIVPRIVHEDSDAPSLLAFARVGLAWTIIASEALERAATKLTYARRALELELWLHWRSEETLGASARALRDAYASGHAFRLV